MNDPRRHFTDHFDGTLSEEGKRELCEYVKANPRNARELIAAAFIHTRLREKFRGWNNGDSGLNDAHILPAITDNDASETTAGADVFAQAAMNADRIIEKRNWRILPRTFIKTWPIAAGLLTALIGVGVWHWAANRTVAKIIRQVDAKWNGNDLLTGSRVRGEIQLKSGFVEIAFDPGASVVLEGPALARINSGSKLELVYGKLTTNVPPPAVGFTVTTGRTSVIDQGTEIGIDARQDRPLHVEVFKGKAAVQIADSAGAESERKVLTESMAVAVTDDGHIHDTPTAPLSFARTGDVEKQADAANMADNASRQWTSFSDRLRRDKSVIAYYPFDNQSEAPTQLRNRALAYSGLYDGTIGGPQWTTGRLAGRASLHFGKDTDHIGVSIPGRRTNLTVAQWVHFDGVQSSHADLFMGSRLPQDISFHWQLTSYGASPRTMFVITQTPNTANNWDWHPFPIPSDLAGDRWHFLAFSFEGDTHTIRAYVDGQLIGKQEQKNVSDLTIGNADIGNFKPNGHPYNESIHGRMDEMVIWNRVVTDEEIAAMYAAGSGN